MEREEKEFLDALEYYRNQREPGSQETLVGLLKETQEIFGCIPADARETIAKTMGVKESVISRIIKLYPSLRPAPRRREVRVCTGPNCTMKGGGKLLEAVRKEMQASEDFRLSACGCMKQCRTAPNIEVDGRHYPGVKAEEVADILKKGRQTLYETGDRN